ncbi:MAG: type II toxin-antitoxin system VapC family toxin [Ferruginibacter sp.]|nr:type II toxin-antitoxin system VapC family toxin [Ferruginibacter sp.]
MAKAKQILVDTDILIKVFRGDAEKKKILDDNKGSLSISIITYLELLSGLKSRRRIIDLNKQMKAYNIIHLSEKISIKSLALYQKYLILNNISLPDALIASTAIINGMVLMTDNQKDFKFIKELSLFKS